MCPLSAYVDGCVRIHKHTQTRKLSQKQNTHINITTLCVCRCLAVLVSVSIVPGHTEHDAQESNECHWRKKKPEPYPLNGNSVITRPVRLRVPGWWALGAHVSTLDRNPWAWIHACDVRAGSESSGSVGIVCVCAGLEWVGECTEGGGRRRSPAKAQYNKGQCRPPG